ncbi:LOG family protein YvdD [Maioricimonas rarisocia]|uniref:Cytokinin riboside 5'-monophosphate phosphoribohydrolase n=1 Tax=Maioricimonas rarisocia TaxID=2528026 RepID=A0A517ZFP2_9PLAN|nr:TIGR00730 family Rossman fold protein [Maioricimonas rarisocia]QDU41313.1 LOG family protein YvdD [Maioricimonas rarisocia]
MSDEQPAEGRLTSLCVFCGSSHGTRPEYQQATRAFGQMMAREGLRLVYGGGDVGLMGVLADAVMEAGGEVTGVIPDALMAREVGHHGITDLRVVGSMHERKALMADLADGFVALPGGLGTFEELCEILTWAQLGIHTKPVGLLDIAGYYDHFAALLDHATAEGFVREAHRDLLLVETEGEALLQRMRAYRPPTVAPWLNRQET